MKPVLHATILLCLCFAGHVMAQHVTPSFVVPTELPQAGLRILIPARSVEEPLPPLERRLYHFRQGDRTWTEERYAPREIWLRSQMLGQWRDHHGNRLRIFQPRYRLPSFSDASVQRADYDARSAAMPSLDAPTSAALMAWVGDYLEAEPGEVSQIRFVSHPLQAVGLVQTESPLQLLYVLRVSNSRGGGQEQSAFFVAEIVLVEGADIAMARRSFEERFLRSLVVFRPQEPAQMGTVMPADLHGDGTLSVALARSRAEAHASVANLRNWQSVDIGDYVLLSDQRRGANQLVRDLERTLEPMRAAFAAMVPPLRPIRAVGIIRIFADQEEYMRYVGENFSWSSGLWSEARGELVIRPVDAANYQQARERIMRTVIHEAFHQYLSLATAPLRACVWFNEGHAVLFEHTNLRRNDVAFEEHPRYGDHAIDMSLAELFALNYDTFYHTEDAQRRQHYATAWALVYYLRRSAAADPQFRFAGFLDAYMQLLGETGKGPQAMQTLLGRYDLQALEADFRAFWSSTRRRRDALRAP